MAAATDTTPENDTEEQLPVLGGTLGSGVPDEAELTSVVGRVTNIEKAFDALVEKHRGHMERKRQELDADVANATVGVQTDANTKAIVTKLAQQKADKTYNEFVRGVRDITAPDRDEMLRQLDTLNKRAAVVQRLFPSPVQMLAVAGLGSAERTTYHAQTAHAGPAELASLANYALANGNAILAAALMARLGTLPKGVKPFTAQGLAEAVVGERHKALTTAAKTVSATYQRFLNQNRAFERGKTDLNANIADALRLDSLNK